MIEELTASRAEVARLRTRLNEALAEKRLTTPIRANPRTSRPAPIAS